MAKSLVVFYSRKGENFFPGGVQNVPKGNTAYAAEYIAAAAGADIFEVDTIKPYAEGYRACCMEAAAEAKSNARPAVKGYVSDITPYDTIFVCYPNWCGTMPMCMFTFLDHYDLTGKRIIATCTNEGSGFANSLKDLANAYPKAIIEEGLSLRGHLCRDSKDEITNWVKTKI